MTKSLEKKGGLEKKIVDSLENKEKVTSSRHYQ